MYDYVWLIIKVASLAYAGLCLLVYLRQTSLVYYPDRHVEETPAFANLPFEDLVLATPDSEQIQAWYVPAPADRTNAWTLLYCHGNAGDLGDRIEPLRTFHQLGLNVLIFDYRGYGASTGKPTEAGTYTDALTAWRYLVEQRHVPPARILVYGHSLGGAVAAWLAEQVHPGALLLESTFTSAGDMGAAMFPYLPIRLLARYRYDTMGRIARVACPVLIAHGTEDATIPFAHGPRLFAAAAEPKQFVSFPGDHNSGGMDTDTSYRAAFQQWLANLDAAPATREDECPSTGGVPAERGG